MLSPSRIGLRALRASNTRCASTSAEQAQSALVSASEKSQQLLKTVQLHAGNALGAYKEPIFGNVAVAREVLKQVYVAEKLSPPSLAQITTTYSALFKNASDAHYYRHTIESGQWKRFAILALELYGIFTIGEMLGRRHIVGYGLDESKPVVE